MEILNNSIIEKNSSIFKNTLVRVVDMIHFEGSLLTLFENPKNKTLYLLDWVDRASRTKFRKFEKFTKFVAQIKSPKFRKFEKFTKFVAQNFVNLKNLRNLWVWFYKIK
jgi:hypothetical protein